MRKVTSASAACTMAGMRAEYAVRPSFSATASDGSAQLLEPFDLLDQRIDRRTIAGVCRTKAAGFGQPRVAFSGARMTGVKADNRG